MSGSFVGYPVEKQIDQFAAVSTSVSQMRPVGAPDSAVRARIDDTLGEVLNRLVAPSLCNSIGRREFQPGLALFQKLQQLDEVVIGETIFFQHIAHMIDDKIVFERSEEWDKIPNDIARRVELNVPPTRPSLLDHPLDVAVNVLSRPRCSCKEIEPNSPYTCYMICIEIVVTDILLDHDHATGAAPQLLQSINRQPVISAIVAGLYKHHTIDPEMVTNREILTQRPVWKRVVRLRDRRIARLEDMKMHVTCIIGKRERRLSIRRGLTHSRRHEHLFNRRVTHGRQPSLSTAQCTISECHFFKASLRS